MGFVEGQDISRLQNISPSASFEMNKTGCNLDSLSQLFCCNRNVFYNMTRFGTLYLHTILRNFIAMKSVKMPFFRMQSQNMMQQKAWIPKRNVQAKLKHLFSFSSSVRSVCGVFYQCIDCDTVCLDLPFKIKNCSHCIASHYAFIQDSQASCKLPTGTNAFIHLMWHL